MFRLAHLNLTVTNRGITQAFYAQWFGFNRVLAEYPDGSVMVTDPFGFVLALRPTADVEVEPVLVGDGGFALDDGDGEVPGTLSASAGSAASGGTAGSASSIGFDAEGEPFGGHVGDDLPDDVDRTWHFGFVAPDAASVRRLGTEMTAEGIEIFEVDDSPEYVGFKVQDPDGHVIEVYFEPH